MVSKQTLESSWIAVVIAVVGDGDEGGVEYTGIDTYIFNSFVLHSLQISKRWRLSF